MSIQRGDSIEARALVMTPVRCGKDGAKLFRSFRHDSPGIAQPTEDRASNPEVGFGEDAVKSDEEAALLESLEVFGRELVRAKSTFVLEHVIDVGAVKDA